MTSLFKRLCFIIVSITFASPALAFVETAVDFDVYNATQHAQLIQANAGDNVFETTLVNNSQVLANDPNWVKFHVFPDVLDKGFVLNAYNNEEKFGDGLGLGVVRYAWWSEGYLYATRIKFTIKNPGFRDRVCDIRLEVESVGNLFDRSVIITGIESANIANKGICQSKIYGGGVANAVQTVSIKIEPDATNHPVPD